MCHRDKVLASYRIALSPTALLKLRTSRVEASDIWMADGTTRLSCTALMSLKVALYHHGDYHLCPSKGRGWPQGARVGLADVCKD